jgi:hypothetical protein
MAKSEIEHLRTWFCIICAFVARDFLHLIYFWTGRAFKAIITFSFQLQLWPQWASIPYSSWIKHQTDPVNRQRGTLEKQAFQTLCYNLFEIPKGNPQHFDDNTTMNTVITLWELLPKCQTITFIMNSNCKLPWLLPTWLRQLPRELPSTSYQQGWSHPWFRENNICGLYSLSIVPIAVWITILAKSHGLDWP